MTDGHEVYLMQNAHERHIHEILNKIDREESVSQRSLATSLGIALGLTNLLVRRLVRKGWVRAIRIHPNRVRYLITPAGIAEKARMSRTFFIDSLRFYVEVRNRVREKLAAVSAHWPDSGGLELNKKRIVFYGAGEVAEVAYICLQETDLALVAVVDDSRLHFFGLAVHRSSDLTSASVGSTAFDRIVVTDFKNRDGLRTRLEELGVPSERVDWL